MLPILSELITSDFVYGLFVRVVKIWAILWVFFSTLFYNLLWEHHYMYCRCPRLNFVQG